MAVAERELTGFEEPRPYHWTREQFYQMGEIGLLDNQRVELIEGEIVQMPPIGPAHQGINTIVADLLRHIFGDGFFVRGQPPSLWKSPTQLWTMTEMSKPISMPQRVLQTIGSLICETPRLRYTVSRN